VRFSLPPGGGGAQSLVGDWVRGKSGIFLIYSIVYLNISTVSEYLNI
jgi:hypothetical protein